ncbi:MAG: aldo/keto reductase [Armatimonadia bacterium]|nr:aldo/keto reductase [Armatimonadia bacterium]
MLYRDLCGERVSALGYGCMRLPTVGGEAKNIDEEKATRLLHHAYDEGVNYYDTAWFYHGGESERFVGRALADIREDVFVADKLPPSEIESAADFDRVFEAQLERLQMDYIDFYMLHTLIGPSWDKLHGLGVLDWLEGVLEGGRIGYAGFSFHDHVECFKRIIDAWDWDFCQIQYNYIDERTQAGTEGLHYAADRGIDVVVMEPIRGGALGQPLPEALEAERRRLGIDWSPAQLALRWVFDHREVGTVLSGMNEMEHVEENIAVASESRPGCLSENERELVDALREHMRESIMVDCTNCRYCMPCPEGVNIPRVFNMYNEMAISSPRRGQMGYQKMTNPDEWASHCVECGICEEKCPQGIPIIDTLAEAHEALMAED